MPFHDYYIKMINNLSTQLSPPDQKVKAKNYIDTTIFICIAILALVVTSIICITLW